MPATTLFFWKFCSSLRTSYKDLIWCTNAPNAHIRYFCKRWSFVYIWISLNTTDLNRFMKIVFRILNKHAPIKRKYICVNEAPFMTKDLHKAIMKRCKLRNTFLKFRTLSDRKNYTSQRNLCKKLLKNTKRTYFSNLGIKKITDNRTFWKTVAPLFSNKFSKSEKIIW